MKIKAISLWQPWATAWALGLKKGETRHWVPRVSHPELGSIIYKGPLAVHAAKTERDRGEGHLLADWFELRLASCERSRAAFHAAGIRTWADLPRGCIIAVCMIDAVKSSTACAPDALEQSWGNYAPGRFIWMPACMTLLPTPIPCTGRQSLFDWEVPADLLANPKISAALTPLPF